MIYIYKPSGMKAEISNIDFINNDNNACIFDDMLSVDEGDIIYNEERSILYLVENAKYFISFRTILSHFYVGLRKADNNVNLDFLDYKRFKSYFY